MAKQSENKSQPSARDRMMELATTYWRLILTSLAVGLGLYLFIHLSPWLGISVPVFYYMPTVFVIAIAYIMDRKGDPAIKFTYALFTGFLFLIIITLLTPYLAPYFPYFAVGN